VNIPTNILTMLAGIALTLVSLWYGKNHGLMPVEASSDAALIDGLFDSMMTISMGIFLLVEGVLVICLLKFRRKPGDETDGPAIDGNIPLEIVWTAIPAVIVLVIGVYSFDIYNQMGGFDPEAAGDSAVVQVAMMPGDGATQMIEAQSKHRGHNHMALGIGASPENANHPADLTVDVVGMQYAWIFTYPESGVTAGELHVPVNKDIRINLQAKDVIHAFWLPEFRLKQDVIPGQGTELRFVPTRIGEYPIICAELCGPYHGGMNSRLYVQTQADYDLWLQSQVASQADDNQTVAAANEAPDTRFLAAYAERVGIDNKALKQLHAHHSQVHSL
jgi:cytochrome c oxidase subunit 2